MGTHTLDAAETAVLPRSVLAAGRARQFVDEHLCAEHARSALSAATLAASEMVTEAVLTGDGEIDLNLSCQATTVTLAVTFPTDGAEHDERLRLVDDVAARIIEGISRGSGAGVVEGRRRIWCTIPTGYVPVPASLSRR
ncbi:MAG TPA: hypothetical protein VFJ09_09865 [Nocardioidaceae bacterium]|nr:hypothetical protein [Nocardioidaceae bacterium]